jgi:AcrR family transcriptional regulator
MPRTGLSASEIKVKAIDITIKKMRDIGFEKVRLTDIAKEIGVSHAALYAHFKDKMALMDAVSERWLNQIDESLEAVTKKNIDPIDKIQLWMMTLHRAKIAKVQQDPEVYKAFDFLTTIEKPYARKHMEIMSEQMLAIVKEAILKKRLKNANAELMARVLQESMLSFHHPKLVAQYIHEKREPMLKIVLDSVLKGLGLK